MTRSDLHPARAVRAVGGPAPPEVGASSLTAGAVHAEGEPIRREDTGALPARQGPRSATPLAVPVGAH
ncbi:hypothetical protein [Micromonospora sp. KC723]|uniref:hypothetical protein n=1 Tax=Micromonospora sp. KC723 TaxID=2530381 RepID=UPI001051697C|nr:hypothetical protein [Micromonospora sp. KC723]TDB75326.1 hypothetical protein E1165_11590 [Micromonospora sp. KC723]